MSKNNVFLNDEGIVECQVVGDQTADSVTSMGKKIKTLLEQQSTEGKAQLALDDVTQIGQVPPAARNIVVEFAKGLPYDRLAMLGKGGVIRFGANMLIRASGRHTRLRYFSDRQAAIHWLLEKKK